MVIMPRYARLLVTVLFIASSCTYTQQEPSVNQSQPEAPANAATPPAAAAPVTAPVLPAPQAVVQQAAPAPTPSAQAVPPQTQPASVVPAVQPAASPAASPTLPTVPTSAAPTTLPAPQAAAPHEVLFQPADEIKQPEPPQAPVAATTDTPAPDASQAPTDASAAPAAPAIDQPAPELPVETPHWIDDAKQDKPAEVPAKPEEKPAPSPDDEGELVGIDTVDLESPQGNWLYKRVWWERAETKYEKIRSTVTKIFEMRTAFFAQRSDLDKNILDPFYIAIGIGQGELQEFLTELIASLKEREKVEAHEPDHETKEEEIEEDIEVITKKRVALEDLKKQIDSVSQLDRSVDDAIMKLVDQINRLRSYEQQAWQNFKDIARVLDDKKARELYYKVDSAWRNVQEIQQYLQNQYAASFDQIVAQVKKDITQVQSGMDLLKQQGLDLKEKIAQKNSVHVEEQEPEEQEEQPGMLRRFVINPIMALLRAIGSFFSMLWDYVVSFVTWPFRKTESVETEPAETEPEHDEQAHEAAQPVRHQKNQPLLK